MKLQKFSAFFLLTIIIGLTFSSCDNDSYWRRSQLDILPGEWQSANNGGFRFSYDVRYTDFTNIDHGRERMQRAELVRSELFLESDYLYYGDGVEISFEADGRIISTRLFVEDRQGGYFYLNDGDPYYAEFMYALVNSVINRGSVTLYISGNFDRNIGSIPFLLTINNDVNVRLD